MGMYCHKRYSVYKGKDETPLVIYGTSRECAEAMGITLRSFWEYVSKMKSGTLKSKRWLVCEDEVEEDG